MVDISTVNGIINQLIPWGAAPCSKPQEIIQILTDEFDDLTSSCHWNDGLCFGRIIPKWPYDIRLVDYSNFRIQGESYPQYISILSREITLYIYPMAHLSIVIYIYIIHMYISYDFTAKLHSIT